LDTKFEIEALPVVTRELNIEPPISVSAGLHATFGFRQVEQRPVAGGTMAVSMQAAPVRRQNEA
jgi:predicted GNAT superfamily acetyltransferase